MSNLQDKINDAAGFYRDSILNVDYQLADFNFRSLKPFFNGSLALELGPASGYMTKHLVNEFEQLHVVEGSDQLLKQIPGYPNLTKHCSLFEDFKTDLKFDTIIMSHVLEHIEDPALVLSKIYSWLSDTGVFLVSVPNARSVHRIVAVQMGLLSSEYELNERDHQLGHYRVYDMNALKADMQNAAFKVIDEGGVFLKPVSNSQIENNWTPEMIEGFYKAGKQFPDNCAEIFVVCKK